MPIALTRPKRTPINAKPLPVTSQCQLMPHNISPARQHTNPATGVALSSVGLTGETMADDGEDEGYRWESGYEKTWEVIQEDEAGLLDSSVADLVARAKRARLHQSRPHVRLGIMRHMFVVLDASEAMFVQDLKPTRLMCCIKILEGFVQEFFDQNPISQLGIIVTKNKRADVACELGGNPMRIIEHLRKLATSPCVGEPSLMNSLELAAGALRVMPSHASREVVVLMASLTTCDPGNINLTLEMLRREKIRCSVIGLAAELRIARHLAQETGGEYGVCLDDTHLRDLTLTHVQPPAAVANMEAALIRIGFPAHNTNADTPGKLSYCMCHLNTPAVADGPDRGGYLCPQCFSKHCELPVDCATCGLTLMSAPHLARSYHHLFPLEPFVEVEQAPGGPPQYCAACRARLDTQRLISKCEKCAELFCVDCDLFIHETLHVCPGCSRTTSGRR
ncbi:general transcription factor IIH subunit 2-like isoform X2 [Pollicipes pollicipes]|uniref:general transcription factor IIH subunit 2-like isoform X2 n=1 Tax=Pollicipes pollicipes TaxID=41117 RepID=UPI0018853FDE|nr:general transcription factor IIH subunit 2-like isoform X2 [Pollicipes pollicipes]